MLGSSPGFIDQKAIGSSIGYFGNRRSYSLVVLTKIVMVIKNLHLEIHHLLNELTDKLFYQFDYK